MYTGPVMSGEEKGEVGALPSYHLTGGALEYGASLGNRHCWVTTRGSGAVHKVFSTDLGIPVAGAMAVHYGSAGNQVLLTHDGGVSPDRAEREVQLAALGPGTMEVHPAYQRRTVKLPGSLHARETLFVPLTGKEDGAVVCLQVVVRNDAAVEARIRLLAYARLGGQPSPTLQARIDPDLGALLAQDRDHPERVRVFGCSLPATAYEATTDFGQVYDVLHLTKLTNSTAAEGDLLGLLQVDLRLPPGAHQEVAFVLTFAADGPQEAVRLFQAMGDGRAALEATSAYLQTVTSRAEVLTPNRAINTGALWSKVNMLRVMAEYPQGAAFTNDPGASSNVVVRDAAWFIYGSDHFFPEFSRGLLEAIAQRQYASGKIPEFYSAIDGQAEDYGLNMNDDTPLFVLAVNHHFRATGDVAWLRTIYPVTARACRYILAQRDERGLVYVSAQDPRGNVWAIAGWRNVIPGYSLNGAVTEINAECVAALRAAAHLAENLGLPQAESEYFREASTALRVCMDAHLLNPRNGLYYLNIDVNGVKHTDVTGDEVFPVIFRACSEETGFRIIKRLFFPDYWTSAGLRTASVEDPLYDPEQNVGLLGGVWPGLSWWFAFAAARYHPAIMVRALAASFEHYAADPIGNNTVPGQFSEWFDGASLVNRGMLLSPWEPPRFLWAAVEGVCGVVLQPGELKIQPLIPREWCWIGLRHLSYHGEQLSYFATREGRRDDAGFHIYATQNVTSDHQVEVFERDATHQVRVSNPEAAHLALWRPDRAVLLLGHTGNSTAIVPFDLGDLLDADARYRLRLYDSERGIWEDGEAASPAQLSSSAVAIEAHGFRVITFDRM
jgi:hypothetical protein